MNKIFQKTILLIIKTTNKIQLILIQPRMPLEKDTTKENQPLIKILMEGYILKITSQAVIINLPLMLILRTRTIH